MRFIQEWGYSAPPGKEEEHQAWVLDHEEALRAAGPAGTRLLGFFVTVYSSEKQAGSYRMFVEFDSYAAMDRIAEAMKDGASDFGRLIREHSAFIDVGWNAPGSNGLHKAVADASIFDASE